MQIRMDPKRLRRRVELARIKAQASYARQELLFQAEYREAKRLDEEERRARELLPIADRLWTFPRRAWNLVLFRHVEDNSYRLRKYEKLCDEAEDFIEISEDEWAEIEGWRKARFAAHPSNAEAFPEIAPSPPGRA